MSGRLYLTGFMGCGKSTVAPLLAGLLGYRCVDIDARIEQEQGKSVRRIFSTDGEEKFRILERAALLETAKMEKVVVALGGGALGYGDNHLFVKSAGMLIYLKVDMETLISRVRTGAERPLLSGPDGAPPGTGQLKERMVKLFGEREAFYNAADLVIDAGDAVAGAVAGLIAAALVKPAGSSPA